MNKNKAKCDVLKKVRKQLADKLGINLHQQECTYQKTCTGTCPKCKQEEEILNREMSKKMGALTLSAMMGLSMVGCTPKIPSDNIYGDIEMVNPSQDNSSSNTDVTPPSEQPSEDIPEVPSEYVLEGDIAIAPDETEPSFNPDDTLAGLIALPSDMDYEDNGFEDEKDVEEKDEADETDENKGDKEEEERKHIVPPMAPLAGVLPYNGR